VGRTLIQSSRSVSPAEKAAFHQITGAGKSHVLRRFFGLSESDEAVIIDRIATQLDRAVKEKR
jgi:phage gpG-like protein